MKTALLAVDPSTIDNKNFESLLTRVRSLQAKEMFDNIVVAVVMHPAMFLVPYAWFQAEKETFKIELQQKVQSAVELVLDSTPIVVLDSRSAHSRDIAAALTAHAETLGAEVLILLNQNRNVVSHILAGSVTRAVNELSEVPVLVVKPITSVGAELRVNS